MVYEVFDFIMQPRINSGNHTFKISHSIRTVLISISPHDFSHKLVNYDSFQQHYWFSIWKKMETKFRSSSSFFTGRKLIWWTTKSRNSFNRGTEYCNSACWLGQNETLTCKFFHSVLQSPSLSTSPELPIIMRETSIFLFRCFLSMIRF